MKIGHNCDEPFVGLQRLVRQSGIRPSLQSFFRHSSFAGDDNEFDFVLKTEPLEIIDTAVIRGSRGAHDHWPPRLSPNSGWGANVLAERSNISTRFANFVDGIVEPPWGGGPGRGALALSLRRQWPWPPVIP